MSPRVAILLLVALILLFTTGVGFSLAGDTTANKKYDEDNAGEAADLLPDFVGDLLGPLGTRLDAATLQKTLPAGCAVKDGALVVTAPDTGLQQLTIPVPGDADESSRAAQLSLDGSGDVRVFYRNREKGRRTSADEQPPEERRFQRLPPGQRSQSEKKTVNVAALELGGWLFVRCQGAQSYSIRIQ